MNPLNRASQFYYATMNWASRNVPKFFARANERINAQFNKKAAYFEDKFNSSHEKIDKERVTPAEHKDFPSISKTSQEALHLATPSIEPMTATKSVEVKFNSEEFVKLVGELFAQVNLDSEGAFRVSPDLAQFNACYERIMNGESLSQIANSVTLDENFFAHCIKKLCLNNNAQDANINSLILTPLRAGSEDSDLKKAKHALPQESQVVLDKILDIIIEAATEDHSKNNKMTRHTLALVFAPNLFPELSSVFEGPKRLTMLTNIRMIELQERAHALNASENTIDKPTTGLRRLPTPPSPTAQAAHVTSPTANQALNAMASPPTRPPRPLPATPRPPANENIPPSPPHTSPPRALPETPKTPPLYYRPPSSENKQDSV